MFRAYRYLPSDPAFTGQTLVPGLQLEGNPLPLPANCLAIGTTPAHEIYLQIAPNPFEDGFRLHLQGIDGGMMDAYDAQGRQIAEIWLNAGETQVAAEHWPAGIYLLKMRGAAATLRAVKLN